MSFLDYCEYIRKHGHFCAQLGDNRAQLGITDAACDRILNKWLTPLGTAAEHVYVYRKIYKDKNRPYDATLPPHGSKPVILAKTDVRVELDAKAMLSEQYHEYWSWALRHANILALIPDRAVRDLSIQALAEQSWDPAILANLGAVAARGSVELARREAAKGNACFLFTCDSYNVQCHIFAPEKKLLEMYRCFVVNCRFVMKGLERELLPERRRKAT